MYRYHVSPTLERRFPCRPNKESKNEKYNERNQVHFYPLQAQTSTAPLGLTAVRKWRPAQQEILEQLRKDGLIKSTGSGSNVRNGSGSRMHDVHGRLERVPKGGSRLDERIELARLLREKRIWSCGAMASQERRGRIVDSQNKLQETKRRRLEEKMRNANERKQKLIDDRVAQSRRNEYSAWGYLP